MFRPLPETARNATAMKTGNMLDIMAMLLDEPLTRAEIARRTGLTRAAVTIIVDRLINEAVLRETAVYPGQSGQASRLLHIQPQRFLFMGIDISRSTFTVGVTDLRGCSLLCQAVQIDPGSSFAELIEHIQARINRLLQQLPQTAHLQGSGISVPGPVDHVHGLVINPPHFKRLQGQNVLQALRQAVPTGIWIENNASARALYEKHAGNGRLYRHFLVLTVDTGIGSGLVLDKLLYRGSGYAGELGHTSLDRTGPPCDCGNRGCLEGYASVPAVLRRLADNQAHRPVSSWKQLVDLAEKGHPASCAALRQEADYLAQGIINATNLLDLEAVILAGDLIYKPALLLKAIIKQVQQARITRLAHDFAILAAQPREDAGMAGAAMIAMDRFFAGHTDWPKA